MNKENSVIIPEADYDDIPMETFDGSSEFNECDSPATGSSSRVTGASDSPLVTNRHHRPTVFDIAQEMVDMLPSHNMAPLTPGASPGWMKTQRLMRLKSRDGTSAPNLAYLTMRKPSSSRMLNDSYAAEIADTIAQNEVLMDDSPESEQLRLETLREMPEALGLKRNVKARISRTVSLNSQKSPPGAGKRFKYRLRTALRKMRLGARETVGGIELWYTTIKDIEGRFGSGVATYFRFLRSLLLLNITVLIISFGFLVTPQLLDRFYIMVPEESHVSQNNESYVKWNITTRPDPYGENPPFHFGNLITGEGWFTDTELYYGTYSNQSISLSQDHSYDIPSAYFFTIFTCYIVSLVIISSIMAKSYRLNFIEMQGGLKNTYAQKIFCGWDFGIVNAEAAQLRSQSIFNELRELLQEEVHGEHHKITWQKRWTLLGTRVGVTVLVATLLVGSGVLVWFLLDKQDMLFMEGSPEGKQQAAMMMSLVVTFVMLVLPMIFSRLSALEKYSNPRNAVFVTLLRTFGLEVAIVGVLLAFWLSKSTDSSCWETNLGQEVYRLIIVDFFICLIGTSLAEFARSRIHRTLWISIGAPEFDIARNTLNLIYNQTLFLVGFYFSPLLAAVIVIKLFITFYVKKWSMLYSCQPSPRCWRAAQTQTVFLALTFLAIIGVLVTMGYIITQVATSDCGPFNDVQFMYEKILEGTFQLTQKSTLWSIVMFFTKPGVVGFIIVALCVLVYYMRAVSRARGTMVELLRNMLELEAEDKIYLQQSIRDASKGQWIHHSPLRTRLDMLIKSSPKKSTK